MRGRLAPRHPRFTTVAGLLAVLLVAAAPSARADSGQWSWGAGVGLFLSQSETEHDGAATTEAANTGLSMDLSLAGNIVHPQFAPFNLDASWLVSGFDGTQDSETRNVGLGAGLRLFPKGAFPAGFSYRRASYDYSFNGNGDAPGALGNLDSTETWNGFLLFRRGFLSGARVTLEGERFDFVDSTRGDRAQDRQVFFWSRLGRVRHSVQLVHEDHDYGSRSAKSENYRLHVEEAARFGEWNWNFRADGVARNVGAGDASDRRSSGYGLRNSFTRTFRTRDNFTVSGVLRRSDGEGGPTIQSGSAAAGYRWRFGGGWEVGPILHYGRTSSSTVTEEAPRGGLLLGWSGLLRTIQSRVEARGGYGYSKRDDGQMSSTNTEANWGLTGTFAHRTAGGLGTSLDFDTARNEFTVETLELVELPDLELPEGTDVTLGRDVVRFSLGGEVQGRQLNSWVEWRRIVGTTVDQANSLRKDYRAGLQFRNDGLTADLRATSRTTERTGQEDALSRNMVAEVAWRYRRFLTLVVSAAKTRREVRYLPDIDNEQYAVRGDFQYGRLILRTQFRQSHEGIVDDGNVRRRDVSVSLSTYLGGRLPIVTGTRRRGVIR